MLDQGESKGNGTKYFMSDHAATILKKLPEGMRSTAINVRRALRQCLPALAVLVAAACMGQGAAFAQVTVDGTLNISEGYGSPLTTQTINTGFGDNISSSGTSGGGSELDAIYASSTNGYLYLFISGNVQANGNNIDIFIANGQSGGQQVLQIGGSPSEAGMNGSTFSPGFASNLIFTFTNSATILSAHLIDL